MFNKAIEILYLAEICKYMKTPHSCHDFGPTLDTELNVNKYVRMLNDIDTQQDSQSWASLTRPTYTFLFYVLFFCYSVFYPSQSDDNFTALPVILSRKYYSSFGK